MVDQLTGRYIGIVTLILTVATFALVWTSSSDAENVQMTPASLGECVQGNLDPSWGNGGIVTTPILDSWEEARSIALQPDGKVVAAGRVTNGPSTAFGVVRYNANGSLDTSFDGDGKVITTVLNSAEAHAVAVQPDGKIVAAGQASGPGGGFAAVRYNSNGTLDTSFDVDGKVTTPVVCTSASASSLAIQPDGKIVLAGSTGSCGANNDFAVVRYNPNGSLDTTFGVGGKVTTPLLSQWDFAEAVALQADGRIVVAGRTSNNIGTFSYFAVVRYNTNGELDLSFDGDGQVTTTVLGSSSASSVAIQLNGKIVVGGTTGNGSNDDFALVRYNSDGSLDPSFDGDGKVTTAVLDSTDHANAIALQPDGKIIAAGTARVLGSTFDFALVRYKEDGSLDSSFHHDGKVTTQVLGLDDAALSVAVGAGGRIVAGGYAHNGSNSDFAVVSYLGSCDPLTPCAGGPQSLAYNETSLVARDGVNGPTGVGSNSPIGNRTPVILIHGIHGNRQGGGDTIQNLKFDYFQSLIHYLQLGQVYNNNFKTYSFHYVSDRYTTKEIARAMRDHVDARAELAGKEIILIAHSMGGIVARHYMLQASAAGPNPGACSGARVRDLYTLATPHHGTYGANHNSRGDRFPVAFRPLANGLLTRLDWLYWDWLNGCPACTEPSQVNRRSLLWDNYDGLLALYTNETPSDNPNDLTYPGINQFFNNRITAFSGVIAPDDPNWDLVKQTVSDPATGPGRLLSYSYGEEGMNDFIQAVGAYVTDSVYLRRFSFIDVPDPRNDGLVPIDSARFDQMSVKTRIHCPGYNHEDMKDGDALPCQPGGKPLFRTVKEQIVGTSLTSPALLTGPLRAGFGSQTYGPALGASPITLEVSLPNVGDEPLEVTSLSLAGAHPDQFSIVNPPSTPFSLAPLARMRLMLAFNPTSPGTKRAELRVANNSSNGLVIVQISATGLPRECELNIPNGSQFMPVEGGTGEVLIGNINCPWTTSTTDTWIHPTVVGDRVTFSVDANVGQEIRHGSINFMVHGRSYVYSISQDAVNSTCWLSLSADQAVMQADGGTGSFYLTSPETCGWSISADVAWLVPNRVSTQGSSSIGFTVTKNFGSARSGVITIQGAQTSAQINVHQFQGRSVPFDYDSDGRTDFSVFRPVDGAWYLQRTTAGFYGTQFGAAGDRLTPADYDGDGKTDIAVYRPSSGTWYILNSATNTVVYPVFGVAEDLPAPGDYDGDGKADLTVFRPSQGTWYRQNSTNGSFFGFQFGQNGDVPTVGDFDGDGKNDLGIWRPSIGDWYNIRSSNGSVFGERFGQAGDKIAPADYDGDGKTDIAIFRPSTGLWVVRNSALATYSYHVFGAPADIPISGDYDGDGKADIGVWRPSDGTWYISRSTNGQFIVFPWGQNGDKPTPSAFGN